MVGVTQSAPRWSVVVVEPGGKLRFHGDATTMRQARLLASSVPFRERWLILKHSDYLKRLGQENPQNESLPSWQEGWFTERAAHNRNVAEFIKLAEQLSSSGWKVEVTGLARTDTVYGRVTSPDGKIRRSIRMSDHPSKSTQMGIEGLFPTGEVKAGTAEEAFNALTSIAVPSGGASENPQDIRTLEQGIFDKSRSSGPTGTRRTLATAEVRNEHGALLTFTVYSNRTRNRWWLQKLVGEKPDPSWDWSERAKHAGRQSLHYSFGTSSPQKAQDWIEQVNRLASGTSNPKHLSASDLLLLPGPGLLEEEIALAGALVNPRSSRRRRRGVPGYLMGTLEDMVRTWAAKTPGGPFSQYDIKQLVPTLELVPGVTVDPNDLTLEQLNTLADMADRARGFRNPLPFTLDPRHVLRYGTVMRHPHAARSVSRKIPAAKPTRYKGVLIFPVEGGFSTSLERESVFDTAKDAKRFVDAQKKNPLRRRTA